MHQYTVAELIKGLRNKAFSSVEICQHFFERCKKFNPQLNCFISLCEQDAMQQAKLADEHLASGTAKLLTGIPLAHKDIFCTQGTKTTCASKMLDNFIAPYNATVVNQCQQAGTVLLGKTNMDEFAMGSSNETSFYGPVKNPWQTDSNPGGSSGGSAAAIAAGLTPLATGTDTGGSIRQPAAHCGITGLKPTYGRVSRWGMIAFASSLDQGGPMARSAEDAAYLMQAMAGFDEKDSTSRDEAVSDYLNTLNESVKTLTVGLPKNFFNASLDGKITKAIEDAKQVLSKLGVEFKTVELPHAHTAIPAYYIIAPAEASSNLARYDGVRYGHRCHAPRDLNDLYERSRAEGFGDEVKRRILTGTYTLSSGYFDAYYLQAQKVRRLIRDDYLQALQEVDLILAPTTPSTAPALQSMKNDPTLAYLADIYTLGVNLAGLPAISLPIGFDENKPIGMQLIGNYFNEARLLNVTHQYQQVTNWHRQIPEEFK